jgi:hypothetical protein
MGFQVDSVHSIALRSATRSQPTSGAHTNKCSRSLRTFLLAYFESADRAWSAVTSKGLAEVNAQGDEVLPRVELTADEEGTVRIKGDAGRRSAASR